MNRFACSLTSLSLCMFGPLVAAQNLEKAQTICIEGGELSVVFRDNSQSPGLLSGIDSLFNVKHAPDYDAFDPDNPTASAGLNFEHIISGHRNPDNKFTPRHGKYSLYKLSDGNSVKLVRRAEDSPWRVASEFEYRVNEPHYVDFEFRCTPQDATLFGERRYAILFFANYMNDVSDVSLHFRGKKSPNSNEEWMTVDAPKDDADWNGGGNYRSLEARDLKYDEDVEFRLNTWSYDWPRFTKPFYFGLADQGMTLILMLDRMYSEREQVRFSLFKFKLDKFPRPAWDFQYVINQVSSGEPYGFRGRMVWKKFISRDDCFREYTHWVASLASEK